MCDDCGCLSPSEMTRPPSRVVSVDVHESLLAANDRQAAENRQHIEDLCAIGINLMSSPGAGKTTLLEHTIEYFARPAGLSIGVIEGDIETDRDAARIRAKGVPAVQLTTGGACHLDARIVHRGIHELCTQLPDRRLDILFIENVGNLVCPASFALGEHLRAVLLSVPEGSDKPAKYPRAFQGSQLYLQTKSDLLPYFDFSPEEAEREARRLNPAICVMALSTVTPGGLDPWFAFLRQLLQKQKP